jgi:hypothetical protein
MQLQPKGKPGRNDRKIAAYASEIFRLRLEGYTLRSIRDALADVGIEVGATTLRREIHRQQRAVEWSGRDVRHVTQTRPAASASSATCSAVSLMQSGRSGREIAEAYFKANPSNPLLRASENS